MTVHFEYQALMNEELSTSYSDQHPSSYCLPYFKRSILTDVVDTEQSDAVLLAREIISMPCLGVSLTGMYRF